MAKAERNYVATEKFYVAIELAKVGRISVAIELATTESSATHDSARRAKAGAHDSVDHTVVSHLSESIFLQKSSKVSFVRGALPNIQPIQQYIHDPSRSQ